VLSLFRDLGVGAPKAHNAPRSTPELLADRQRWCALRRRGPTWPLSKLCGGPPNAPIASHVAIDTSCAKSPTHIPYRPRSRDYSCRLSCTLLRCTKAHKARSRRHCWWCPQRNRSLDACRTSSCRRLRQHSCPQHTCCSNYKPLPVSAPACRRCHWSNPRAARPAVRPPPLPPVFVAFALSRPTRLSLRSSHLRRACRKPTITPRSDCGRVLHG